MNDKTKSWVRADLQGFTPYNAKETPCKHKLDANESPFNLPTSVRDKMIKWFTDEENLNIYPDTDSNSLRKTIAQFWNVCPENVVCGVGSDQLIDYITKVFLNKGETLLTLAPTFSMYGIAASLNGGKVAALQLDETFNTTVSQVLEAVKRENAKLLFLCTPNNPTGTTISKENIIEILQNVDIPVVVDEAYGEFTDQTTIPNINDFDNLIVLKTFSKAYGLAAARVGYAIANENLITAINIVKGPYNLPVLSQILAEEVLKESETYKERIAFLTAQTKLMKEKLSLFSWLKVYDTGANFIYIESEKPVVATLAKHGIVVRFFSNESGIDKIRLSVGTVEQNEDVIKALKTLGVE